MTADRIAGDARGENHDTLNREVVRIANMMLHDGIPADEQDNAKIDMYVGHVDRAACGIPASGDDGDEQARGIVYEALFYRKLKDAGRNEDSGGDRGILEKSSEFGAGFS